MSDQMILYSWDLSPPVRAVKIVARLLDLELEICELDLFKGEHLEESFKKINPEHTVPTLVDGNFSVWNSHAICAYLVDKYGKDDSLYPADLQLRARCNQRLFFVDASLFTRFRDCSFVIYKGGKHVPQDKIDQLYASYEILEAFLANDSFLVGNSLTIADVCAAINVISSDGLYAPLQADKHPNILAWLNRIKQTITFFDELNEQSVKDYRQLFLTLREKNQQD